MRSFHQFNAVRDMALCVAVVVAAGCTSEAESPGTGGALDTDDQKASYGIGFNVGSGLVEGADRIDRTAFARGLEDALLEADPAIPQEELAPILTAFETELQEAKHAAMAAVAEENVAIADTFLTNNGGREGVTTTESGLQYEVIEPGDGPKPGPNDRVTIHYRGTLVDGTQFDSSYDRDEPATFGVTQVIPGFSEGLQLMSVGSKYRLYIPPDLGYGPRGTGPIPPNSALIFDLELLEIVQ